MPLNKTNKIQVTKCAPPPSNIPVLGKEDPASVVFLGRTNYVAALEEKKFIFGIKREDRKKHIYMIGKSGVGKSKLQEVLIRQDIAYGQGVCVIDPYGELIEDVLDFIPKERVGDVVYFNPEDTDYPFSFNPLSNIDPTFKHQFTKSLIEVLQKLFGEDWSPRVEHLLRFSILALLDHKNSTMRGMIKILIEEEYRKNVVLSSTDDMVKHFWMFEFSEWEKKYESDVIIPVINKLWQFLSNPLVANIFGQSQDKLDFEEIMNNKKILLINLSKDKIGEENASFLGAMFLAKIKQAGISRFKNRKNKDEDFYIYLDEFHCLATETFENILSESRKYGISLVLAHQYFGQLNPKIGQAILGNVGNIVLFRVGGDDASKIKNEFSQVFEVKDMINLGVGEFYIKMIIDGESYDPFSAETLKVLPPTHQSFKQDIVFSSRTKYCVTASEAQKIIASNEKL